MRERANLIGFLTPARERQAVYRTRVQDVAAARDKLFTVMSASKVQNTGENLTAALLQRSKTTPDGRYLILSAERKQKIAPKHSSIKTTAVNHRISLQRKSEGRKINASGQEISTRGNDAVQDRTEEK